MHTSVHVFIIVPCPEEAPLLKPVGSWTMVGCEWRLFCFLLPRSVFSYFLSSGAEELCKRIVFCPSIYFSLSQRLHISAGTFTFQKEPKRANITQCLFLFFHPINVPHLNRNKKNVMMDNDLLR